MQWLQLPMSGPVLSDSFNPRKVLLAEDTVVASLSF
jgi:hypothetical protein